MTMLLVTLIGLVQLAAGGFLLFLSFSLNAAKEFGVNPVDGLLPTLLIGLGGLNIGMGAVIDELRTIRKKG